METPGKLRGITGYFTLHFFEITIEEGKKIKNIRKNQTVLFRLKLKAEAKTPTSKSSLKIHFYLFKKICLAEFSLIYFVDRA